MKRVVFVVSLVASCGGDATPPPNNPPPHPSASASATAPPTTASASAAVTPEAPKPDPACVALDAARKPEIAKLKMIVETKDPMSNVQAMSDDLVAKFGVCNKTKAQGAWGLGLRDLKEEQHGVSGQLIAFHADAKGQVTSVALQGTTRTKDRAFQSHDQDHVGFDTQSLFDFDGDGEDEYVVVGHDQTKPGPLDVMAYIVQVKDGAARPYPPAKDLPMFRVEDVDRDGRPDFISYGPYRARVPARCNGDPQPIVGPAMLVHSLPDGSFSMTDDKAMAFVKQHCDKPGFSVARDDEKHVDDDQTFVNIACARLWGMSETQAVQAVAQSCTTLRGEATCKEDSLKTCVYGTDMTVWARAKPPLLIK